MFYRGPVDGGGGGGVIAIVDGGGPAVNKELRREVREISSRRPFLPTTDRGGGGAQKCAKAPRALPGTPDGQSSPGCGSTHLFDADLWRLGSSGQIPSTAQPGDHGPTQTELELAQFPPISPLMYETYQTRPCPLDVPTGPVLL